MVEGSFIQKRPMAARAQGRLAQSWLGNALSMPRDFRRGLRARNHQGLGGQRIAGVAVSRRLFNAVTNLAAYAGPAAGIAKLDFVVQSAVDQ